MINLGYDESLRFLIYPISDEAYSRLENDIKTNGCLKPILVWGNTIVDGKTRYNICREWDIPFNIEYIEFKDQDEAVFWICKEQLKRKDLPEVMHRYLLGKCYRSGRNCTLSVPPDIADRLAEMENISRTSIYRFGSYSEAIDTIASKNRRMALDIIHGNIQAAQPNVAIMAGFSSGKLNNLERILEERGDWHITNADMDGLVKTKRQPVARPSRTNEAARMPIKETPQFDPDADISSLTFTVPSWIGSIKRTCANTDFTGTSPAARDRLLKELYALKDEIMTIQNLIREASHND